jgi:hypothetical protein
MDGKPGQKAYPCPENGKIKRGGLMIIHHTPYKKMTEELTPYGKLCLKLCTIGL